MTKYIGIDPDVDKSGFAIWESVSQDYDYITQLPFWDLIEHIERMDTNCVVYVEASWQLKKSNWHNKKGQSKAVGEKIAKAVGANHQVGKLIVEYCKVNGVKYVEILPQGKFNAKEFKQITGITARTNSEKRDAALLVYGR